MSTFARLPAGVTVTGKLPEIYKKVINNETLSFLAVLHRNFNASRKSLLQARLAQQAIYDAGSLPDFDPKTAFIRNDPTWQGPVPGPGLEDRRVEITGPVDRKMVINALNSGAKTFMADFEDSNAPTWKNNVEGQINLFDACRRTIAFTAPNGGKSYKLNDQIAVLLVRPRGLHLEESNIQIDGENLSGSFFDFGVYFFNNAAEIVARGGTPAFYIPKLEHSSEARLWNDVFRMAQDAIGMRRGTIRATVLIETIPAAFQMEEILWELREHSSGLNCGRWDYIFSFIKKTRFNAALVLPDRDNVAMTVPFLDAYVRLLIKTCHKRGVHAMGGMSAQIPIKNDEAKNNAAIAKVKADKTRECAAGHDGTWVAHPALVKIALDAFNLGMVGPNQFHIRRENVVVTAADLLNPAVPGGITEGGIRENISALLHYCGNWIGGLGCVPVNNMMEDAATAEISRCQIWSWVYHGKSTVKGDKISVAYIDNIIDQEAKKVKATGLEASRVDTSAQYLKDQIRAKAVSDFLTTDLTPAMDKYIASNASSKL